MKRSDFALPLRQRLIAAALLAVMLLVAPSVSAAPFVFSAVPALNAAGSTIVYDAGTVSPAASATVEHRFILENGASVPVTLARIEVVGKGTVAEIDNDAAPSTVTLAPGDLVGVKLTVAVPKQAAGFTSLAQVYIVGQNEPAAVLRIDGVASKGYALLTHRIRFGAVKVGTTLTKPVYLLVAPHVLASGNAPVVVSADPDIRMTAPSRDVDPSSVKGIVVPAILGNDARLLAWQATFAPQAVGPEKSRTLWLAPASRLIAETADPHIAIEAFGSADPEIAFGTDALAFGDRVRGTDWSEWVPINASNPTVFSALRFDSGSLYLQLDLVDPAKHVTIEEAQKLWPNVRYLQVILSAVAPLGKLATKITVTTGTGQILTLPVTANVVDTKPRVKGK